MKTLTALLLLVLACPAFTQDMSAPTADPFKTLAFLEGTWDAKTPADKAVSAAGTYTFKTELNGHILARHSTSSAGCKGPATFDCDHGDLLYVFQDAPGQPLKAIYFDNEGHVLHYNVSTPDPATVIFLSDGSSPGPQLRLTYNLRGSVMSGKFQILLPGQTDWQSYLEWSGAKK